MRKTVFLLLLTAATLVGFGQASPVPAYWDCNGTPPTGFSTNTNPIEYYVSSNYYVSAPSALKLAGDDQYLLIEVNDQPGQVDFWFGGTGSGQWEGTFEVQESDDGNSWNTIRTWVDGDISTTSVDSFAVQPASTTRFIRFYYTDKVSGHNLAIDDVNVRIPTAGPTQDIVVEYNGVVIPNGGRIGFNSPVGTPANIDIEIRNYSTQNTLQLTAYNVTGSFSGDYSAAGPDSVVAGDSLDMTVTFTPAAAGTRDAMLEIVSNDPDEGSYMIELYGVGGNFATEPAGQPSNLNFSNVLSYSMDGSFTGTTADGYLVLRRKGSAVTDVPVDGQVYDKGTGIGNSKVFYVGDMTNFEVGEMAAGTEYYFAVFSYNGFGSYTNYNTAMPLLSSQTSAADGIGNYYNGIDTNLSTFVTDLTTLVNNHSIIFYSDYKETMIDQFLARDTAGDQFVVNCEYSNEYKVYSPPFDFTLLDASREHRFASSWMPTFGSAAHDSRYAYADQHDLALVNQTQVNAVRNNEPFGEVVNASSTFGESSRGTNSDGVTVFEVRDAFKGDVARAIFYMSVAYHNAPNDASQGSPVSDSWAWDDLTIPGGIGQPDVPLTDYQDIELLMSWHMQDPPSAEEMARNDFIHDNQGNRNPFVDHPEWLCQIDFTDMSKTDCGSVGINDLSFLQRDMAVMPNPSYGNFTISFNSDLHGEANLRIVDLSGKEVFASKEVVASGLNALPVRAKLATGMYILEVELNGLAGYRKIQVR